MSGDSGLSRGLQQGLLQGIKAGGSRGSLHSGVKAGLRDNLANKLKMQDPALLTGNRLPWIYTNADNAVNVAGQYTYMLDFTNVRSKWLSRGITSPNIIDSGYNTAIASTQGSSNNRPWIYSGINAGLGLRNYLDFKGAPGFNSAISLLTPITTQGVNGSVLLSNAPDPADPTGVKKTSSMTFMMVMKITNSSTNYLLYMNGLSVPGDGELTITTSGGLQNIGYKLWGNSSQVSNYNTAYMPDLNDWCLVTVKADIRGPVNNNNKGAGSEQQIFVNGKLQHNLVSNNWSGAYSTTTFPANQDFFIGSNSSLGSNINLKLAAVLLLPYWANESEQLLLENYFRWYYNKRF